MTREELGAKLRLIRKSRKLSIIDVSEKAGLSRNTLTRIEEGKFSVNLDTMNKVFNALDIKFVLICNGAEL